VSIAIEKKVQQRIFKRTTIDNPGFLQLDLTFLNAEVIMMVVRRLDRMLFTRLLPDKKTTTCRDAFKQIVEGNDIELSILMSDQGGEWKGEFKSYIEKIDETLKNEGKEFKRLQSLPVSAHMNGMIENLNRIKKSLRMWLEENPSYTLIQLQEKLQQVTSLYNNQSHSILDMSPFEYKKKTIEAFKELQPGNASTSKEDRAKRLGEIHLLLHQAEERYMKAIEKTENWRNNGRTMTDFSIGERIKVSNQIIKETKNHKELYQKIATIKKQTDHPNNSLGRNWRLHTES